MVLLAPPAGWTAAVDADPPEAVPAAHLAPPGEGAGSAAGAPSDAVNAGPLDSFDCAALEPPPADPQAPVPEPPVVAAPKPLLQKAATLVTVGGVGLSVVVVAAALMVGSAAPPPGAETAQRAESDPVQGDPVQGDPPSEQPQQAAAPAAPPAAGSPEADATPELPPAADPTPAHDKVVVQKPETTEAEAPAEAGLPTTEASNALPTEPAAGAGPIDPLDVDPANLDLVLRKGPAAAPPPARKPPEAAAPRIALSAEAPAPRDATIDARLANAAQLKSPPVRRRPTGTDAPASGDAPTRLASRLPGLTPQRLPLWQATELLTTLSGVPITLPPEALDMAGVSPRQPVTFGGRDVSLAQLLGQALHEARLEADISASQAVAVRPGLTAVQTRAYDVSDLMGDDPQSLESLLRTMAAPDAQGDASGLSVRGGQLQVQGDTATHYSVRIFCERLRKARGLAAASKYPQDLLHVSPALEGLRPTLDRKTTFSFVDWTPMAEIVAHWRQVSRLTILVDWRELESVEISPQTLLACGVVDRPWTDALDSVLGPLGLAWRPIDGETIEITTREAADRATLVEFYPLAAGQRASASDLARAVEALGEGASASYDQAASTLIVRAATAAQRDAHALLTGDR
ncbi:hypothetical protein Pla175_18310 [Pirellulimonas nuda]|uniref:Uncharacterized protein n=2 Tax=Pirellulimonas nuda TaxID=2528009 RepID=A0A518DAH4_9BACT|nr:hypothetical protein Pla175_18310 [Pirellulimonas nuda]